MFALSRDSAAEGNVTGSESGGHEPTSNGWGKLKRWELQRPVVLMVAPLWFLRACAGSWDEHSAKVEREKAEEELRQAAEQRASERAERAAAIRRAQEAEEKRLAEERLQQEQADAAAKMTPSQRRLAFTRCVQRDECDLPADVLLASAKTQSEAKGLEATRDRIVAQREWASAPLLCADGTTSPSCTCGARRRGCCSHHGGVVGCSANRRN